MSSGLFASSSSSPIQTLCTTSFLPADGVLNLGPGLGSFTLTEPVAFMTPCPPSGTPTTDVPTVTTTYTVTTAPQSATTAPGLHLQDAASPEPTYSISNYRDPFYLSTFPMCYALAATTITSYMLVIMLFITPRSFLDGGILYLGRRAGFTHGSTGGETIGGRPHLQKLAAITVAISLTIATADTFRIVQKQYAWGAQNAFILQGLVMNTTRLKVMRLISDTFLWLAQAQTLIRLFPRHREKVIIKWAAFALITLDFIFSAVNSFQITDNGEYGNSIPKNFDEPVPALSYLFSLALGLLYAAWVIYYSLMKKRYAFYHPLMPNMPLVAIVSISAITIPVVFFILDMSEPTYARWGDYVRWVGAAAASVVVWEWVERIEALEREEKKDGILGREVFDGDDMLEVHASESPWLRNRKHRKGGGGSGGGGGGDASGSMRPQWLSSSNGWAGMASNGNANRTGERDRPLQLQGHEAGEHLGPRAAGDALHPPLWPARPRQALTPISRTDTPSAASTVYAVRYQAASESTSRTPDLPLPLPQQHTADLSRQISVPQSHHAIEGVVSFGQTPTVTGQPRRSADHESNSSAQNQGHWRQALTQASNPLFNRSSEGSSAETPQHLTESQPPRSRNQTGRWDLKSRIEDFAVSQADRIRERLRPTTDMENLPVTVIPAPARRGAALQQVLEDEELHNPVDGGDQDGSSRDTSVDLAPLNRHESALSGTWPEAGQTIPATNPPLWPGVRSRGVMYDDDDASSYVDSLEEMSSSLSHERESDYGPGHSRGP